MQEPTVVRPMAEPHVMASPQSELEKVLIDQYLAERGHTRATLKHLPPEEARRLMTEACRHVALQLTEIDCTAHVWESIHGRVKSF